MKSSQLNTLALVGVLAGLSLSCVVMPKAIAGPLLKMGTEASDTYNDAQAVFCPRPEIPAELHDQCFKSCCIARFIIKTDGKSSVRLVSSSGSTEVDDIALSTLQRWKFKPATIDGKPVESARKIKVEFEIEE